MVERVALLRPAGTTAEEEPPGVVDRAQTSTELLEVWAPVQLPESEDEDAQEFVAATALIVELRVMPTMIGATNRSFGQTTTHSTL